MRILLWIAAAMMLAAAALLIADVGAPGLWFAVITVGIAAVAVVQARAHHGSHP
jgi:hypothetical protein